MSHSGNKAYLYLNHYDDFKLDVKSLMVAYVVTKYRIMQYDWE